MADSSSTHSSSSDNMSGDEQSVKRNVIRKIMQDPKILPAEKSRLVQALMDGRRRSSTGTSTSRESRKSEPTEYVSTMAQAAAAAAEYYSSDDDNDEAMTDVAPEDIDYEYNQFDSRSVSSEITHTDNFSVPDFLEPGEYRQAHGRSFSLQDWNWKDEARAPPTVNLSMFANNPEHVSRAMEQFRPLCNHYERNCTLVAPCCGLAFGCRICHDDCPVLPPPLSLRKNQDDLLGETIDHMKKHNKFQRRMSMPLEFDVDEEENHHLIDRFAVREIICRKCYTRQSSKTNNCTHCEVQFGEYHCNICNLWMSRSESPYHCEQCGFCRVGGRDNFRHCQDCGMCIDSILFEEHNCKSGKYMSNCPVCQEDLFSSRYATHELPCAHAMHWHCFKELTSYDTRCPVCKKTAETPEQMAATWNALAMGIALQPVPPDMARVVNIACNDCEMRDSNRRWHFLGVRCDNCLSFNTVVEQTLLVGREAAEYLDMIEGDQNTGDIPNGITMPFGSRDIDME